MVKIVVTYTITSMNIKPVKTGSSAVEYGFHGIFELASVQRDTRTTAHHESVMYETSERNHALVSCIDLDERVPRGTFLLGQLFDSMNLRCEVDHEQQRALFFRHRGA